MTVTIVSLVMGLGVDPGIQYTLRYKAEFTEKKNYAQAIQTTQETIGSAIFTSSMITSLTLLVFGLSNFLPTVYIGVFVSISIVWACMTTLIILPSLLSFNFFRLKDPWSQENKIDI